MQLMRERERGGVGERENERLLPWKELKVRGSRSAETFPLIKKTMYESVQRGGPKTSRSPGRTMPAMKIKKGRGRHNSEVR